jgi:outer membrane protein OmpA-like peptidoglycan-associated protein
MTRILIAVLFLFPANALAQCPARGDGITVESGRLRVEGPIRFDLYAGTIDPATLHTIDAVARRLIACPDVTIEIQVHTDTRRMTSFNARASSAIAEHIRARLIERGVPAARIAACGYGESRPAAGMENWDPLQNRVEWIRIASPAEHRCPPAE